MKLKTIESFIKICMENGGTAAMKKYWEVFNHRADGYERIIKTEFKL